MKRIVSIIMLTALLCTLIGCSGAADNQSGSSVGKAESSAEEVFIGKAFTVGDYMVVTFDSAEWAEEIFPPNPGGSIAVMAYTDKEGEAYFVIHGTAVCTASEDIYLDFSQRVTAIFDGASYDGKISVVGDTGADFYGHLKPSETSEFVMFVSVPDSVRSSAEEIRFEMSFPRTAEDFKDPFTDRTPSVGFVLNLKNTH